jgi:menaquinone reductase, molybdopterin-binding-like subunit
MGNGLNRRDFLKFLGGGVLGTIISPLPWKLLDDSAIWTQNWSWLASPVRGAVQYKNSHCSLCPAGCGMRVRCVGDQPVALLPKAAHLQGKDALCANGLAGHHLPYHPLRIKVPRRRENGGSPRELTTNEAVGTLTEWVRDAAATPDQGSVAILDGRPQRALSMVYQRFLSHFDNGLYLTDTDVDGGAEALSHLLRTHCGPLGLDLDEADTILSFGAPVLDGWLAPGRTGSLMYRDRSNRHKPLLIQVETRPSRTAIGAERWLRINPGSEVALAMGIARVIVDEQLFNEAFIRRNTPDYPTDVDTGFKRLLDTFTVEKAAAISGIPETQIRETARRLATARRAVAVIGTDPANGAAGREEALAVWGLNLLIGSLNTPGGYQMRAPLPLPEGFETLPGGDVTVSRLTAVADHSIKLLIIDPAGIGRTIPQQLLARKLVPEGARIVSLSPYATGIAATADLVIPAPAPMEMVAEIPAGFDQPHGSYAIAPQLLPRVENVMTPAELIVQLGGALECRDLFGAGVNSYEALLRRVVAGVYEQARGVVFNADTDSVFDLANVDSDGDLWDLLLAGGCWIDKGAPVRPMPRFIFPGYEAEEEARIRAAGEGRVAQLGRGTGKYPLVMIPFGTRDAMTDGIQPPESSKIYRESDLRLAADQVLINPETARTYRVGHNRRGLLETPLGKREVVFVCDAAVMPGVVHVAAGPTAGSYGDETPEQSAGVLELCELNDMGEWKYSSARVREA